MLDQVREALGARTLTQTADTYNAVIWIRGKPVSLLWRTSAPTCVEVMDSERILRGNHDEYGVFIIPVSRALQILGESLTYD